jgi:hypothetical protein
MEHVNKRLPVIPTLPSFLRKQESIRKTRINRQSDGFPLAQE